MNYGALNWPKQAQNMVILTNKHGDLIVWLTQKMWFKTTHMWLEIPKPWNS